MVFGLGKSCHFVTGSSYAILTNVQLSAALNYYLRFPRTSLVTPAFYSLSSDVAFVSADSYVSAAWEANISSLHFRWVLGLHWWHLGIHRRLHRHLYWYWLRGSGIHTSGRASIEHAGR